MRLTGTINALSAVDRSMNRPNDLVRAFKPGCSFMRQSEPRQPD
jgi:hypothetical protein